MAKQQELFPSSFEIQDGIDLRVKLRKKLQGDHGIIKKLRNKIIPSSKGMARLAQEKFENEDNDFTDPDLNIETLIGYEYCEYIKYEHLLRLAVTDFPLNEFLDKSTINKFGPSFIYSLIGEIFGESMAQSRKSRAGTSLMEAIDYSLKKTLKFSLGKDFQRENPECPGCAKLDFLFPNSKLYKNNPQDCCIVACQTTSNDRSRLIGAQLGQCPLKIGCTAIGSRNFPEKLGIKSLTAKKLKEFKEDDITLVVFKQYINDDLRKSGVVISYAEWYEKLNKLRNNWGDVSNN